MNRFKSKNAASRVKNTEYSDPVFNVAAYCVCVNKLKTGGVVDERGLLNQYNVSKDQFKTVRSQMEELWHDVGAIVT